MGRAVIRTRYKDAKRHSYQQGLAVPQVAHVRKLSSEVCSGWSSHRMGDWMGSCVDVKLADGMGHFGQMTEMPHSLS